MKSNNEYYWSSTENVATVDGAKEAWSYCFDDDRWADDLKKFENSVRSAIAF